MKNLHGLLLGSVSIVALAANASAADLPMKAPPRAPVEVWSWTGPYIGINGGAAWHRADFEDLGSGGFGQWAFLSSQPFWSPKDTAFTIGGQIGYNWQVGAIVFGLEGDLNWVDGKTSTTLLSFGLQQVNATTNLDWFATLRGRLGVTVTPTTLLYATGGVAIAHFENAWGYALNVTPDFSSDKTRTTWVVGGGIEQMLTRNWTIRLEGLYADFGDWTITGPTLIPGFPYRSRFSHTVGIARGALNWKW
jgi:outer membrane immunogenic protein